MTRSPVSLEGLTLGLAGGGGGGGPPQPPGLSQRNLACLRALVAAAVFLAGTLGPSWFAVLEALQNADYVLTTRGTTQLGSVAASTGGAAGTPSKRGAAQAEGQVGTGQQQLQQHRQHVAHPLLADADPESVQAAMQRLFDASVMLDDSAFHDFVDALCKLSFEMVSMQSGGDVGGGVAEGSLEVDDDNIPSASTSVTSLATPRSERFGRRVSGIHIPRTLVRDFCLPLLALTDGTGKQRSGDFSIARLGGIAALNIQRLVYRSPDVAWDAITSHLLFILRHPVAPQPIRLQAARTLDDILAIVPRHLSSAPSDVQAAVQRRMLDVLSQQIMLSGTTSSSTTMELRRFGLETLHQILQASGHTLLVGWETIFEVLGSVCRPAPSDPALQSSPPSPESFRMRPPPLTHLQEKGYSVLIKIAFQCMTLMCDSLSVLSPDHLRLCITTLGQFGRQADTNIALTAAESLFWGVSDAIQAKRREADHEPAYSALWMHLLLEILRLCDDGRPEVRLGAIQTLFRILQLYGATLSLDTWDECIWKVTFPLPDMLSPRVGRNVLTPPSSPDTPASATTVPVVADGDMPTLDSSSSWDESKVVALQSMGSILNDFLVSKIIHLPSFGAA
jgi:C-terminal region of Mon2 protein